MIKRNNINTCGYLTLRIVFILFFFKGAHGQLVDKGEFMSYTTGDLLDVDFNNDNVTDVIMSTESGIWGYANFQNGLLSNRILLSNYKSVYLLGSTDFNQDGFIDILFAANSKRLYIIYGMSGGGFSSPQMIYNNGNQSIQYRSIEIFDIDLNGYPDIILATPQVNTIEGLMNNSSGVFTQQTLLSYVAPVYAFATDTCDINSDGILDIAVCETGTNYPVRVYSGDGNGNFSLYASKYLYNASPADVLAVDINGDGTTDYLTADGWYSGTIIVPSSYIYDDHFRGGKAVDIDNDGDLDAFIKTDVSEDSYFLENNGTSNMSVHNISGIGSQNAIMVDITGNGLKDIIYHRHNNIFFCENNGNFNFSPHVSAIDSSLIAAHEGYGVLADVNGDGTDDFVTTQKNHSGNRVLSVNYIQANGSYVTQIIDDTTTFFVYVAVLDVDQNSSMDIVVSSGSQIYYYANDGMGNFSKNLLHTANGNVRQIESADLDNNGIEEIIYREQNATGVTVLELDNQGNVINSYIAFWTSVDFILADVDGDSLLDFITSSSSGIYYTKNQGNHTFGGGGTIYNNAPATIYGSEPVDFDLDGDLDFVMMLGPPFLQMAWVENTGTGTFNGEQMFGPTFQYSGDKYLTFDYDQDGDNDVLVDAGSIILLENQNNNFYSQVITDHSPSSVINILKFDYTNDNDEDVLLLSDYSTILIQNFKHDSLYEISGSIYYDVDQNGVMDVGEPLVPYATVNVQPNLTTTGSSSGKYKAYGVQGSYTLTLNEPTAWSQTSLPLSYTVQVDSTPGSYNNDFGIYPDSLFHEWDCQIVQASPSCNSNTYLHLNVHQASSVLSDADVVLEMSPLLTYDHASITPDSIVGQNYYWHLDSLLPNEFRDIQVYVQNPGVFSIGQYILNKLTVSDNSTSFGYVEDMDSLNLLMTCAYDPNDKQVFPNGVYTENFINHETQTLEYLIRFQNTGTDTAKNVVIKDPISNLLDISSIQILSTSHAMTYELIGNECIFSFQDIYLPDSGASFVNSQGFVKFSIDIQGPKTHLMEIENFANIYFDFNPAIITNTSSVKLFDCNTILAPTVINIPNCIDDSLFIQNNEDYVDNYEWTLNGTIVSTDSVLSSITSPGNNLLEFKFTNLICSVDSNFQFMVTAPDTVSITYPNGTDFCAGDSISLISNAPQSQWIYNGQTVGNNQVFHANQPGMYYAQTFTNGCLGPLDSVEINEIPIPIAHISGPNAFCAGDTVWYISDSTLNNSWYLDGISAGMNDSIVVTNSQWVVLTNNFQGCSFTDSLELSIYDPIASISASDSIICPGDSILLSSIESNNIWHQNNQFLGSTNNVYVTDTGWYYLKVYEGSCISEPDSFFIMVHSLPDVDLNWDGQSLYVSNTVITDSIAWYLDGVNVPGFHDSLYSSAVVDGTYTVWVWNGNGCADSTSLNIVDGGDGKFEIAGVSCFPNPGSGELTVKSLYSGLKEIRVYDMVGKLVLFETNLSGSKNIQLHLLGESGVYIMHVYLDNGEYLRFSVVKNS